MFFPFPNSTKRTNLYEKCFSRIFLELGIWKKWPSPKLSLKVGHPKRSIFRCELLFSGRVFFTWSQLGWLSELHKKKRGLLHRYYIILGIKFQAWILSQQSTWSLKSLVIRVDQPGTFERMWNQHVKWKSRWYNLEGSSWVYQGYMFFDAKPHPGCHGEYTSLFVFFHFRLRDPYM